MFRKYHQSSLEHIHRPLQEPSHLHHDRSYFYDAPFRPPSGRRRRSLKARTTWLKHSFFPEAVRLKNFPYCPHYTLQDLSNKFHSLMSWMEWQWTKSLYVRAVLFWEEFSGALLKITFCAFTFSTPHHASSLDIFSFKNKIQLGQHQKTNTCSQWTFAVSKGFCHLSCTMSSTAA